VVESVLTLDWQHFCKHSWPVMTFHLHVAELHTGHQALHWSSARLQGIAEAVATIRKERRGRDVYVLGAANVGKSAFVRSPPSLT